MRREGGEGQGASSVRAAKRIGAGWLALLFVIALVPRIAFVLRSDMQPSADALEYDLLAQRIVAGEGYVDDHGHPTSFRPPLYPYLVALVYRLAGHACAVVYILQSIVGAATVVLLALIASEAFTEKVALMSGLCAALYESYIVMPGYLVTETIFTFILMAVVYLVIVYVRKPALSISAAVGAGVGLLALTRPVSLGLAVVLPVVMAISSDRRGSLRVLDILALVCACVLMISPWSMRNAHFNRHTVIVSTNGGLNFYQAMHPYRGKIFGKVPDDEVIRTANAMADESERDRYLFGEGVRAALAEPIRSLKLTAMRCLFYWGFFDWEFGRGERFNGLFSFFLPFACVGFVQTFRLSRPVMVAGSVIAYFALAVLVSQGAVRYRLPTDGLILIVASSVLIGVVTARRARGAAVVLVAMWAICNLFFTLESHAAKGVVKGLATAVGVW